MENEYARRPGGRRHLPGRDLPRLHDAPGSAIRDQRERDRGEEHQDDSTDDHDRAAQRPGRPPTPAPEQASATAPERRDRADRTPADTQPTPRRTRAGPRPPPPPTPTPDAGPTAPAPTPPGGGGRDRRRRRRRPTASQAARRPAHRRRPRARHVAAVGVAEAPGQLGRLGDADPLAHDDARLAAPAPAARAPRSGRPPARSRSATSPMPSAWVSLPGPEQRSSGALEPAPLAHQVDARRPARARGSAPPRPPPRPRTPR